jgi:undecaprenyl-diphosphatase
MATATPRASARTCGNLYTTLGVVALAALLALAWWNARRAGSAAMGLLAAACVGIGCAVVANEIFKALVTEARPCQTLPASFTVVACPGPTDYAFPSNHSAIAGAIATAVFLLDRRLGAIAALLALVEGFSRIYIGVHYPHDVVVGLAVGAVVTAAVAVVLRRPAERIVVALENTPLRIALTTATPSGRQHALR